MAGHANLVLFRDRDDALQEVSDALPVASALTAPAFVSAASVAVLASASFQVQYVVPPRPGVRSRSTPSRLMLYLIDGMPTFAQFLMMLWIASMSLSRSGLCPSMMAGRSVRSTWLDARNGGAMQSSAILCLSQKILRLRELFDGEEAFLAGVFRIATDIVDAVALEELQMLVVRRRTLAAELHQSSFWRCRLCLVVGRRRFGKPRLRRSSIGAVYDS